MTFVPDHDKPRETLNLVKLTAFEAMAAKVAADNKIRDRHIGWLEIIMSAYSYIMCVLEASPHPMTLDDVTGTIKYLEVMVKKNDRIKNDYCAGHFRIKAECLLSDYLWKQTGYFHLKGEKIERRFNQDILLNKSAYWDQWRKTTSLGSEKPLTTYRLHEDLWDAERQRMRYDKLLDFIKHYPWAFPPNVVELHKELVNKEAA